MSTIALVVSYTTKQCNYYYLRSTSFDLNNSITEAYKTGYLILKKESSSILINMNNVTKIEIYPYNEELSDCDIYSISTRRPLTENI